MDLHSIFDGEKKKKARKLIVIASLFFYVNLDQLDVFFYVCAILFVFTTPENSSLDNFKF